MNKSSFNKHLRKISSNLLARVGANTLADKYDDNEPIPYNGEDDDYKLGIKQAEDLRPETENELFNRFELFKIKDTTGFFPPSMANNGFQSVVRARKPSDLYWKLSSELSYTQGIDQKDLTDIFKKLLDRMNINPTDLVEQRLVYKTFPKLPIKKK